MTSFRIVAEVRHARGPAERGRARVEASRSRLEKGVRLFWGQFGRAGIPLLRHLSEESGLFKKRILPTLNVHLEYSF